MRNRYLKVNRDGLSLYDRTVLLHYPEITDHQAELMLHALGADHKEYRSYKGSKTYHAYRNYYDAGGKDIAIWNDLVEKELAEKHTFYHVTVKGIRVLEFLTQCRIWDDYDCVADAKTAVHKAMMKLSVFCGYGCWEPITAKEISLDLAIPIPLVRKTLNRLAEEGYVYKGHYGSIDDDGYPHCLHGWYVTKKTEEMPLYREYEKQEYARIDAMMKEDA